MMEESMAIPSLSQASNPLNDLDNGKQYAAKVRNLFGDEVDVVSSSDTPASSYGLQHWIDTDGNSYGQITLQNPFYEIYEIQEITQEQAEAFFESE
jgi:hypothetical protein